MALGGKRVFPVLRDLKTSVARAEEGRNGRDELRKGQIRQGILGHGGDLNFNLSAEVNAVIERF